MFNFKMNWDALGISASIACAIHCAILPLFLTSLPVFGIEIINNELFEISMIVLAFLVGAHSLYHGWKKHHHNKIPILIFSIGIIFLVLKQFFHAYTIQLLIIAVTLIITAHILNYRKCRLAKHCHKDDCTH